MIKFNTTRRETDTIFQVIDRAERMGLMARDRTTLAMDLSACHSNGCPLKLGELLAAPDGDFAHDIGGIQRHINRETGQLEDCFLPRYAQPETAA